MDKRLFIPLALVAAGLLVAVIWLSGSLRKSQQMNEEMQELAELEKQEMENEYERFTVQYGEMMQQINNDSIVAQLTREQMRTQELLEELKQVKAADAREITRLKKELATVRAVLRDYVMQIDSLNRLNENLRAENNRVRDELAQSNRQREGLESERQSLSEKVAIAAQLDATGISLSLLNKREKATGKLKDARKLCVAFTVARNVTATNGIRTFYVRIQTPNGTALQGGTFPYENRQLEYSMKKAVEYTGEETPVTLYWNVGEMLSAGDYRVSIFAEGNMIGSKTFTLK